MSFGQKNLQLATKKTIRKKIGKLNKSLEFFSFEIGSTDFRREYAIEKIDQLCDEMKLLTEFPITEPQTAFRA